MNQLSVIEKLHRVYTDFLAWKSAEFGKQPEQEIGGEWECNYAAMPEVWAACFDFAQQIPAHEWQPEQARQLLYLTARDNESEYIAGMLPESALLRLCETYRQKPVYDAGWQLAVQLPRPVNHIFWVIRRLAQFGIVQIIKISDGGGFECPVAAIAVLLRIEVGLVFKVAHADHFVIPIFEVGIENGEFFSLIFFADGVRNQNGMVAHLDIIGVGTVFETVVEKILNG